MMRPEVIDQTLLDAALIFAERIIDGALVQIGGTVDPMLKPVIVADIAGDLIAMGSTVEFGHLRLPPRQQAQNAEANR